MKQNLYVVNVALKREAGEQVLELEELAHHRGSLLGDLPGDAQPTQKLFDSALLDEMRRFDVNRTVWVEAESKKIGDLQLPEALCEAMHRSPTITIETPMSERRLMHSTASVPDPINSDSVSSSSSLLAG